MFSRLKKSLQGSQDTLQPKHHENKTFHDVRDLLEDFEVKSNLSSCQSEILESQRRKKKVRKAKLRNIFKGSEPEASSIVRNDHWSCNRSISMQVLTEANGYKMQTSKKKVRKSSEAQVQTQKSLSMASLPQLSLCRKNGKVVFENGPSDEILRKQNQRLKKSENTALSSIDVEISAAELEYELEKYKLKILNLKQNLKALKLKNKNLSKEMKEETLYQKLSTSAMTVLKSEELSHDQLNGVEIRKEGFGLEWWDECTVGHLKVRDRVLELNRMNVFKITNKEWNDVRHKLSDPVQAVFMRTKEHREDSHSETIERIRITDLKSNITQIQQKLEKKFMESINTSKELERAIKERNSLGKENMRLLHRVAFLEDHTKELKVGMKQIQNSLERTLKSKGIIHGLAIRSMSNERCSTATFGFYSPTESDCSNSKEQSTTNTKHENVKSSEGLSSGLLEAERKLEKHFHKNTNTVQSYVSRIPPPKPLRYNLQKSSRNLPYLRANSDGDQSSNNTIQNPRILRNKKKAASYMNIRSNKDSQILV